MKRTILFRAGFSLCICLSAVVGAQSGSSTRDGVYTAEQAGQGHAVYTNKCEMCHGPELNGSAQFPPLTGGEFLQNWTGQTLGDLYSKIQVTMPSSQPGTLKPDEVSKLIAYILSANKFPAGKTALPQSVDALTNIHIESPLSSE